MSDCERTREWLLEAGREDIRQASDDLPESLHLSECEACAALAARLERSMALLDGALGHPGAGPDTAAILAQARLRNPAEDRVRKLRPRHTWVVLAAAAALVGLSLWADRPTPMPGRVLSGPTGSPPVVSAYASEGVAVFATDNPDITVLWFY